VLLATVGAIGAVTHIRQLPADTPTNAQAGLVALPAANQTAPAQNAPYATRKIGDLPDTRIDESSGIGASRRYPGCIWTHNDSGDSARLFLLDGTGKTLSEIVMDNADARDWEDMSVAGDGKNSWVYVGDIGDNAEAHPGIVVYRFQEPEIDVQNPPERISVSCERMVLQYPDRAHNAETLVAAPDGHLLIVTKSQDKTLVFKTPQPFTAGATQQLQKLGEIEMPEGFRKRLTTAGDISPDGKRLVVITYTQAHEWLLPGWKKDGAPLWNLMIQQKPRVWDLPRTKQMEAVCYGLDSKTLYSTSEQLPAPYFEYKEKAD
jgi:hypothetical protein